MSDRDKLPCLYRVIGFDNHGTRRAAIVIRRVPSDVPLSLDREIMHMGVMGHMKGPDKIVMYEFLQPERLSDAEELLRFMGWKRIKKEERFKNMDDWTVYIDGECIKAFDNDWDGKQAEEYLDKVMLGEIEI